MRRQYQCILFALCFLPYALCAATTGPINVIAAKVTQMPVFEQVQTFGNLVAVQNVTISTEVAGKVSNIFFKDGQRVKKDALLLQLDNTQAKADLISAQADLALSKRNYERYVQLNKYGGTTKQQLDKAQADVNAKEAAVQQDLNTLQKYTMTAPFSGKLGKFMINPGDYVAVGDKLVTLVNNSVLKIVYALPEDTLPKLKMGQQVIVMVDAVPNQTFTGNVSYIAPSINTNTGTIAVQATIQNKTGLLKQGLFATVRQLFNAGKSSNALVVPEECVLASLKGNYVYLIKNNKAIIQYVTMGPHIEGFVEITAGLKLGDNIIAEGQQKLSNNASIRITGRWRQHHKPKKSLTVHKVIAKPSNTQ